MQVRTTIEISQEVQVEVNLDEVMAEIASLETPERAPEALRLLSLCMGAVMKVPDTTPAQKKVIADALRTQLARYDAQ